MMDTLFNILLIVLGIPVAVFSVECILGFFGTSQKTDKTLPDNVSAAILVPAHNEQEVIGKTLESLKQQISPNDSVVVIADNCQDDTANIVRQHGFTAIERSSDTERGKGYALAFGMAYLKEQATTPDIVIIVDADCLLGEDALQLLKAKVHERKLPVQACYLMQSGSVERIAVKVSEFAFMVKNKIRLRGLSRLGMPVPLTGTGMAFPWDALAAANLATGDIVEDMRLGVELAEHGKGATYCDQAMVYSFFPTSEEAEKTQRERWEHGHLSTLKQFAPRLLKCAITKPSLKALGMMLDLTVPPLSLLVMIIGAIWSFFVIWGLFIGSWAYAGVASYYLATLLIVVALTWAKHGRGILSGAQMLHIPIYIVSKIVIYIGYVVRKQTKWIRTDRN